MAKNIPDINVNVDTFQSFISRTNEILLALRSEVLTANSTGGVTGSTLAPLTSVLIGSFTANTISAHNTFSANSSQIRISGVPLSANGSTGANGQVLTSNGSSIFWSTVESGQGFTGSRGFTGSVGSIGFTGSVGSIGFTGSTGSGFIGSRGNTGFTGSGGSIGFTGSGGVVSGSNTQFNSLGVGTTPSGVAGEIRATNNITAYFSDDRLKTRLGLIENPLEMLKTLEGFFYEPNSIAQDLGYECKREVGVSAQQVQAILPEVVAPAPIDNKYLTVRYEKLIPLLIEAIKELEAKVSVLESK